MFDSPVRGRIVLTAFAMVLGCGCHSVAHTQPHEPIPDLQLPKELNKVSLPTYTVESPDILDITITRVLPLPPYKVQPLDALYLKGKGTYEKDPIEGIYVVDSDGGINLGPTYGGVVRVAELSVPDIEKALTGNARKFVKDVSINASVAQSRGGQFIAGQHLVRPDGTVGLGAYGSVYVAGLTLAGAKAAIEQHLTQFLYKPEVAVDVFSFNSKWYYIITDFAGNGEQVVRLPVTGNETVLDAISQIGGLSPVSSKQIWVARPAPAGSEDQILRVDWKGITRRGHTRTNYQVLPGDRVYVMAQPLTKFETYLNRSLVPVERFLGATLLGVTTAQTIQNGTTFSSSGTTR